MKKYNAILVLGHIMSPTGWLEEEVRPRTKKGIELFHKGESDKLIMSGRHFGDGRDNYDLITEAEAMERFAYLNGVPPSSILKENFSRCSLGGLLFTKWLHLDPNNWKNVRVVTGDYHKKRVEGIKNNLFGSDYVLDVKTVETGLNTSEMRESETGKIEKLLKVYEDIPQGDDKAIFKRLFEEHTLYKDPKNPINQELLKEIFRIYPDWRNEQ